MSTKKFGHKKFELLPMNPDGTLKHIIKEGSRRHVVYYDTNGAHCSEANCEFNH